MRYIDDTYHWLCTHMQTRGYQQSQGEVVSTDMETYAGAVLEQIQRFYDTDLLTLLRLPVA